MNTALNLNCIDVDIGQTDKQNKTRIYCVREGHKW